MKEYFGGIFITIITIIAILAFIIMISLLFIVFGRESICTYTTEYEYVNMVGDVGTSNNCYEDYVVGASNTKGVTGLYCDIEGGIVQVTQYVLIKIEEVCLDE